MNGAALHSQRAAAPALCGSTPLPASPADQQSQLVSAAAGVGSELLTYPELASRLKLKRRAVEGLVAKRRIPAIRLNARCVRFRWRDVEKALEKLTIREVA